MPDFWRVSPRVKAFNFTNLQEFHLRLEYCLFPSTGQRTSVLSPMKYPNSRWKFHQFHSKLVRMVIDLVSTKKRMSKRSPFDISVVLEFISYAFLLCIPFHFLIQCLHVSLLCCLGIPSEDERLGGRFFDLSKNYWISATVNTQFDMWEHTTKFAKSVRLFSWAWTLLTCIYVNADVCIVWPEKESKMVLIHFVAWLFLCNDNSLLWTV